MKQILLIASLLLFIAIYACKETDKSEQEEKPKVQMAKETPMQMGMRAMESEMKLIKEKLLNGDSLTASDFRGLKLVFEAESSDDINGQEKFQAHSNAFLESYNSIQAAMPDEKTMIYNLAVENCITCHKSYCPGPVRRIAKLKI
jgi:hypothetical protein